MTTITGTFEKPNGTPITSLVKFVRVLAPDVVGAVVSTGHQVTAQPDTNGAISISLLAGNYNVFPWDDSRYLTILVPASGSADVKDIVVTTVNSEIGSVIRLRADDGSVAILTVVIVDGVKVLSIA